MTILEKWARSCYSCYFSAQSFSVALIHSQSQSPHEGLHSLSLVAAVSLRPRLLGMVPTAPATHLLLVSTGQLQAYPHLRAFSLLPSAPKPWLQLFSCLASLSSQGLLSNTPSAGRPFMATLSKMEFFSLSTRLYIHLPYFIFFPTYVLKHMLHLFHSWTLSLMLDVSLWGHSLSFLHCFITIAQNCACRRGGINKYLWDA